MKGIYFKMLAFVFQTSFDQTSKGDRSRLGQSRILAYIDLSSNQLSYSFVMQCF